VLRYEYELGKAADILVRDLLCLQRGETFVVTADTESDIRVVNATARAAFSAGAKPMVIWTASPLGVGKAADPMLPVDSLAGALIGADAWVEFNNQWLLYSTPYEIALQKNDHLRHLCLVGMNVDMMIRCIGRVNFQTLTRFQRTFAAKLQAARRVRITTPTGTDISFDHVHNRPIKCRLGQAHRPGSEMSAGQISVAPNFETIQGMIVFDGSLVPPVGLLEKPIQLNVDQGIIKQINGGKQAKVFKKWLEHFNDPQMFNL